MEQKKLYKSRHGGTIGGVCTGLGEYFDIEPIILQAIFFLLIWTPVPIIITYLFLWFFMKKEPKI